MNEVVAAILWVAAFVCFLLAGLNTGRPGLLGDRVRLIAFGLAAVVLVHGGWDALQVAINK